MTHDYDCEICPAMYYLLKPSKSCLLCVDNAICEGGSNIYNIEGYWRQNTSSDIMLKCIIDTCLQNDTCKTGYKGVLCQSY